MRRVGWAVAVVGLVVVAAVSGAVADDLFSDVPTSSVFHDEIGQLGSAECADGFPGGLFKPNDAVKRQQMARFFARCGPRGSQIDPGGQATAESSGVFVDAIANQPVVVPANGRLLATATVDARTEQGADCPCELTGNIRAHIPAGPNDIGATTTSIGGATNDGFSRTSFTILAAQAVERGDTVSFDVRARYVDDDAISVTFDARLHVIFVPFALQ
jgi:hypothetical protein